MARCAFIKPGGERCGATAMRGYDVCYGHRPDLAEERRRNAHRGGKAGGNGRSGGREISDVKGQIRAVIGGVLSGRVDRGRAAVAIQGFNALRGVLELERKIREQDEILERIEALERAEDEAGGRAWHHR